jgi:predicted HAD superfamily Cof-like phosphohydrolase
MIKAMRPGVNINVLFYAKILHIPMKKHLDQVKKFHKAFGLDVSEAQIADLGLEKNLLRYKLMREENEEYLDAATQGDMVEVADALGDMLYILCGTIISHGMQHKIEEVFDEIHRSNMSKLGKDGKPIYREDGKVLKGPDYFKPELKKIIDKGES